MRPLRPGQETVLAWEAGAVDCRVVASAGAYVLLQLGRSSRELGAPFGRCSLTYLDGMTPMGWDGDVEPGGQRGEIRFRIGYGPVADRRASVRLPVSAEIVIAQDGRQEVGRLLDVSAGGLRFRHAGRYARGSALQVRFELPYGPLVEADAVVRAAEPHLTAAEFTALHAATAAEIGQWTVGQLRATLAHA